MTEPDSQLILEILRRIQADIVELKQGGRGIKEEIIGLRQQILGLQGDYLRQEQNMTTIAIDLDRIKARLELSDA